MPNYNKLPRHSQFFKGKIYQRMQDDLHLNGMAQRTIYGYLRSVRQLADFSRCSPDQVTEEQLRQWLLHLKIDKQFAYGSLRVAFSGIKFFLRGLADATGEHLPKPNCKISRRCRKC